MKKPSSLSAKKSVKASASATDKKAARPNARLGIQQKAESSSVETSANTGKFQVGLNFTQIQTLEGRLIELKNEITTALESKSDIFNNQAINESLIKGDDAEVAEKQRQSNAALQEMDMLKNRLLLVERALKKIDHGVYGICEETEEPIGFERLIVIPWARYGVKVQEMRERKLRDFRVSRLRSEV